ncbi:uncharacterized protein VTP21DRAFT_1589 [Calcarisporiella thermophila]|uniref:uncharacterized protein n=1 Tax=Calcarisporiella thermophila TaxID=911321 RepID=UPI0037444280
MSVYLFAEPFEPIYSKQIKRGQYAAHVEDIKRGITNTIEALQQFIRLCLGDYSGGGSLAFDAHVGDCGCQYRACMILELLEIYSNDRTLIAKLINMIRELENLREQATLHLIKLNKLLPPKQLGLNGKEETVPTLQQKLQLILQRDSEEDLPEQIIPTIDAQFTPVWQPYNSWFTTKFLAFCYVLRKYKIIVSENGTVTHRLHLKELGGKKVANEFKTMQSYISLLSVEYVKTKSSELGLPNPLNKLIENAKASSAKNIYATPCFLGFIPIRALWFYRRVPILLHLRRFCNEGYHDNFIFVESLYTGNCGIDSSVSDTSSTDGNNQAFNFNFHNKFNFDESLATPSSSLLEHYGWRLSLLASSEQFAANKINGIKGSPKSSFSAIEAISSTSCIVMTANSIDGTYNDYYQRTTSQFESRHCDHACMDNLSLVDAVLHCDFDEILTHFFAQHEQYPFATEGTDQTIEDSPLHNSMKAYAPGLRDEYLNLRARADELGCGRNMHLMSFQHVFSEQPLRYAHIIANMLKPTIV